MLEHALNWVKYALIYNPAEDCKQFIKGFAEEDTGPGGVGVNMPACGLFGRQPESGG